MVDTAVKQVGADAWEWIDPETGKGFGVRAFDTTRRLIWSSWSNVGGVPTFDDGIAQTYESYLAGDAAPFHVPGEFKALLLNRLSGTQPDAAKKRRWFRRQ